MPVPLIAVALRSGEVSDYNAISDLLATAVGKPSLFLADKGYYGAFVREQLLIHGVRPVFPPKANRKNPPAGAASSGSSTASSNSVVSRRYAGHKNPSQHSSPGRCEDIAAILCQQDLVTASRYRILDDISLSNAHQRVSSGNSNPHLFMSSRIGSRDFPSGVSS